jgi:DNA mismatch repair protein MutH
VKLSVPRSEAELITRARSLSGRTLAELARLVDGEAPRTLHRAKGWGGRLIERFLGAPMDNRPGPDFEALGIEVKTLPVDEQGRVKESTYVCLIDLEDEDETWESSRARAKLDKVLWIPLRVVPGQSPGERLIGHPLLWVLDEHPDEESELRADWEFHVKHIRQGLVDTISGHDGKCLQIRPKAADSRRLTWGVDTSGEAVLTLPRGFYLRAGFTQAILRRHFGP